MVSGDLKIILTVFEVSNLINIIYDNINQELRL